MNQRSHSSTLQVLTRTGRRAEKLAGTARAVQPGCDNQRTQLMATATSIHLYNHHNHLHSLTAFPCTPHLSPFRILSHTLHNTVSDQTQALLLHNSQNTLLPASPSAASMTPVSEHQQPKEQGTQAATSHHAPAVPSKFMLFLRMYRTVDHESCIVYSLILTLSILENMMLGQDE